MKKFFVLLLAAATLSVPRVFAQDMFNHMALGVSLGLDGVGIEAAAPMGNHFQIRAGYSLLPFTYTKNMDFGTVNLGGKTRSLNNVPLTAGLWGPGNAKVLVDIYPGSGPFRFTAGLYVGTGKFLSAQADLSRSLTPDEYGTLGIGFEGGPTFTTDKKGIAYVNGKVSSVMPYVGIGFGHAVADGLCTVTFDLGVAVTGGIKAESYNYLKNTLDSSKPVDTIAITSKTLNNKDNGWIDKIGGIPVFPMMKLGVFFKLF